MSAMPVETLPVEGIPDDDITILLEPRLIETLLRTVSHLPPGTPLVLQGRASDEADVVQAVSVLRAGPTPVIASRSANSSLALIRELSGAERRVLQYLRTHLTLAEIASRLYVSRNTVKSQAISTYRKLGVSSRGEAVRIAIEADLAANDVPTLLR